MTDTLRTRTDDLRTRVGRVLQRLYGPSLGAALEWDSEPKRTRQMYLADADAVICEVLTPEFLADLMIAAVQKAADDE